MRKTMITALLVCLALLACALMFTACNGGNKPQTPSGTTNGNATDDSTTDNVTDGTTEPETEAHVHSFGEWTTVKEATCTEKGEQERVCNCGEKETQSIDMIAHTFGDWQIVKESSYTEEGIKARYCSCGEKESEVIEKITILKTVSSNEWKSAFNNFGRGDFSAIMIDVDERVTEVLDDEVYGWDMMVTADFKTGKFYMSGIYFWNDEIEEIDDDSESFEEGGISFGEFICTDWMREFWYEIEDLSDVGYSRFTYDSVSASYHQRMEVDDVLCDVNIYFENGRITQVSMVNATSGDVTLNSTYTYTYN